MACVLKGSHRQETRTLARTQLVDYNDNDVDDDDDDDGVGSNNKIIIIIVII